MYACMFVCVICKHTYHAVIFMEILIYRTSYYQRKSRCDIAGSNELGTYDLVIKCESNWIRRLADPQGPDGL